MSSVAAPLPAEEFARLLEAAGAQPGLSPAACPTLGAYLAELDRWRRGMNLTGVLSAEDLVRHTLESAAGQVLIPHGARVIDIGSGGGYPAIPLAILRPDISMTMVEPRGKRAAFLRHISRFLSLPGAEILESSIESVEAPGWTVVTTRALGDIARHLGQSPFLAPKGLLLAWTTEPEVLARSLSRGFALEGVTALKGAERRVIAALRKG